uniref:Uncharacterized protein n=1 Tax=Arundo donax TaxID=35708 RepID=A0A0A9B221_ARUDO
MPHGISCAVGGWMMDKQLLPKLYLRTASHGVSTKQISSLISALGICVRW